MMKGSKEFYNNFGDKLIQDYVYGNKRIESAIIDLSAFIPTKAENILDIGCGLGWSSYEFAKFFPTANVDGIDLSPVLIEKASKLFNEENLSYKVFDITKQLPKKRYDAIVMIDVYEHIPHNKRNEFHDSLGKIIKNQGRLILSCPTKFHQKWLKENYSEGLQPVDEDIDYMVIANLAKEINGEIIYFQLNKIWKTYDYLYAVIEINPEYNSERIIKATSKLSLEDNKSRILRVKKKLKVDFEFPENKPGPEVFNKKLTKKLKEFKDKLKKNNSIRNENLDLIII